MTDPLLKEQQEGSAAAAVQASNGVGATLRSIREARRISLSDASQRLKFSVRQIEALESEHWERLPNGVSLRGFVRNYARYLEADVDAVLVLFDSQVGTGPTPKVVATPGLTASVADGSEIPGASDTSYRPWGWYLIILAILVVAGVYAVDRGWVPESWLIFDWLKAIANNE
jgi:Uncharacterized protein conserved in bacteria